MNTITWDVKTVCAMIAASAIIAGAFLLRERQLWSQGDHISYLETRVRSLEISIYQHEKDRSLHQ